MGQQLSGGWDWETVDRSGQDTVTLQHVSSFYIKTKVERISLGDTYTGAFLSL